MSVPAPVPSGAGDPPCGGTRGRPRDPELDDEILTAATALVAESGLDGLRMDAVARRAGVAKATIYRRFPSKVDLIVATCQAMSPPPPPTPDLGSVRLELEQLLSGLAASLGVDDGSIMPSVVAAASVNPEVREALHRYSSGRRSVSAEVVQRGIARGELRPDIDVELFTDQLVGAVIYRFLISGRPLTRTVVKRLVATAIDGAGSVAGEGETADCDTALHRASRVSARP